MPLSVSSPAAASAREAAGHQAGAVPSGAPHAGERHRHAEHPHHADHHPSAHRAKREVRVGASVLRMSLAGRLALVSGLLAVLWGAVLLVTGGGA